MVVDGDGAAAGIGGRGFEVGIKGGMGNIQIRSRSLLCCCIYQPAAVTKGKQGRRTRSRSSSIRLTISPFEKASRPLFPVDDSL